MERDERLERLKDIDTEEAAENFMASQSALDTSFELSCTRIEKIEEMMIRKEIRLTEDEFQRIRKLKKTIGMLAKTINEEDESQIDKDKNRELFKELESTLERLIDCHIKSIKLISEDLQAFMKIGETVGNASMLLSNSGQATTYFQIFWDVMTKYLTTNNILPTIPIIDRPNIFINSSVFLKRIQKILNENTSNRLARTRLCLGCWTFVSVDTTVNRSKKHLMFKNTHLPLMIKFSLLVEVKQFKVDRNKSIHLEDLIHFLYLSKHVFLSKEAQSIFKIHENQERLTFVPCPLVKKPKISTNDQHIGIK